MLNEKPLFLTY